MGADLSYGQYSVAGMDIRITGWLCKTDTSDFGSSQVESLILDLQRVLPGYSITGDLDNWNFSSDHISYIGQRESNDGKEDEEIIIIGDHQINDFDNED